MAAVAIPRGSLVTSDLIKIRDYPSDLVPQGAIVKPEDVVDRSAFSTIVVDEPVLESKLSPKGHRGMAAQIPNGMRAITINTNVSAGVAGFILPGNKVDVLLTVNSGGGPGDLNRRRRHDHAAPERRDPGRRPADRGPEGQGQHGGLQ